MTNAYTIGIEVSEENPRAEVAHVAALAVLRARDEMIEWIRELIKGEFSSRSEILSYIIKKLEDIDE